MCWWDYAHSIRGYANRDCAAYEPSRSLENTLSYPQLQKKWTEDEEPLMDIGELMLSTDIETTYSIMDKYESDYILISDRDAWSISYVFYWITRQDVDHLDWGTKPPQPTETSAQTLVKRAWTSGTSMASRSSTRISITRF